MHLPEVGCGAFAGRMPIQTVWQALAREAIKRWKERWPNLHVDTRNIYPGHVNTELDMCGKRLEPHEKYGLAACLFVNAWDPHSFIGNGNERDASLDGWYGRHMAMALLGWPGTNEHLLNDEHFIDCTRAKKATAAKHAKRPTKSKKPTKAKKKSTRSKKPTKTKRKPKKSKEPTKVMDESPQVRRGANIQKGRNCRQFKSSVECRQVQACKWRRHRPSCKQAACYQMTKQQLVDQLQKRDPARRKSWLQRQTRRFLMREYTDRST